MPGSTYHFAGYTMDVATREIRSDDAFIILPTKVFDCVAYLIGHRDRAVGRDELIAAVWGRADITDNLLAQIVLRARRAFDDSGEEQRFIRTIPGFGYRWVHELAAMPEPIGAPPSAASLADPGEAIATPLNDDVASRSSRSESPPLASAGKRRIAAVIAIVLVLAASAAWYTLRGKPVASGPVDATAAASTSRLAAVLPAISPAEADYGWVRLGLMDLIAQRLRDAGQATVSSDVIVAMTRDPARRELPAERDDVINATGAQLLIEAEVLRRASLWTVQLRSVHGVEPAIRVSGEADDILRAADAAASQLIAALALTGPLPPVRDAVDALVQQVEAALLSDQLEQGRELIAQAAPALRESPRIRYQLARIDLSQARLGPARAALMQLASEPATDRSRAFQADIQLGLASIETRAGNYDAVRQHADAAIRLTEGEDVRTIGSQLGGALVGRATSYYAQGQFEPALDDFAAARIALASVGDVQLLGAADINYGALQMKRGRFRDALVPLQTAADLFRRLRSPTSELMARINLIGSLLALQDLTAVSAEAGRLTDLVARSADPEMRLYAQMTLADAALATGQLDAADSLLQALSRAPPDSAPGLLGQIHAVAARRALQRDDSAAAGHSASAALALAWDRDEPRDYARTWLSLARAARAPAVDATSAQPTADAVTRSRQWANARALPVASIYADLIAAEQGGAATVDATRAHYETALRAASDQNVAIDLITVVASYADWLLDRGDVERAAAVLGRAKEVGNDSFDWWVAQLRLYRALGNEPLWQNALRRSRELEGQRNIPTDLTRFAAAPVAVGTLIDPTGR